ncbi:phosphonate ABC transporter substrate-binding protein [Bordetella tumulicola]|uniref:phosphonate ABC transporter substrate-binding protein n=1 Tax=Bordetella tumulicola TaxID=1649133 RepID=UPI0039F12796
MLRRTFLALAAVAAMSSAASAQDAKPLNIGFISTESSTNLKEAWQPLIDDLSKELGVPVKPFFASDYAGIIEGMRFDKVQLGWFGNKSAMEAVDRAKGEVFASVIDKDGNPGYWSILLVNKDSKLQTLEDVLKNGKELSYGAGDPNSTSGTLVPGYFLWGAKGIQPKTFFKSVRAANHEANLLSVINKQVDVAINNTEMLARYERNTGKDATESVRILWKSPLIPADPMVMRSDLPAETKKRIKEFFVNYGTGPDAERQLKVLAKLTYKGFRDSSNAQLIPIRQMALAKDKLSVERDTTLSEADKKAKLAEMDRQLAELDKLAAKSE